MSDDKTLARSMTRSEAWALEQEIQNLLKNLQQQEGPRVLIPSSQAASTETLKELAKSLTGSDIQTPRKRKASVSSNSSDDLVLDSGGHDIQYNGLYLLGAAISEHGDSHVSEDVKGEVQSYYHALTPPSAREVFIATENLLIRKLGKDFLKALRRNTVRNRATDITAYDLEILMRVLRRYFTWINSAYPVMHETLFYDIVRRCHDPNKPNSVLDLFQMKIVLAIALASISRPHLSTSELGHNSHAFYKSAMRLLSEAVSEASGLVQLRISLLILQYTLLVPKSGNLWQLAGSAMRIATELGLYAEPAPGQNLDPLTLDLRRRLFWTCYCMDRTLSTIMSRPSTIPDSWITVEMPSLVEDSLIQPSGIQLGPTCHLKLALVHHVHICRLHSEIHGRLYAPGHSTTFDTESLSQWTWHTYDQLRAWRLSDVYATPLITREWIDFQFHIGVVLLLRPSPNRPNPTLEELHVAFHSAGQAMTLVKIMHREASAVFAWLTVQNLFMCGLTYIKYLRSITNGKVQHLCKPFVEIILEVQACTSMLETLSALDSGDHEQIRNVFEAVSSNVLQDLANSAYINQTDKSCNCIWDQLSKNSHTSMQRPINIPGYSPVEIQTESNILLVSKLQERDNSLLDDDHFFQHDVDANPMSGYAHVRRGVTNLANTFQGSPIVQCSRPFKRIYEESTRDFTNGVPTFGKNSTYSESADFDSPLQDNLNMGINGADLPDDTSTNLERWFLYPF